jgi:adenylate cyclase
VASNVAGVIEPTLHAAEIRRSSERPTNDLNAYDLYLRAYALALSPARQRHIHEAIRLLDQAIDRDPNFGLALAWGANCRFVRCVDGRSKDPQADSREGVALSRRALEVAGDDPAVLANAAMALAYFGEDIGAMMALIDRALALNPNYARGWQASGAVRVWAGQPDVAIEHVNAALRLSPRARVGTSLFVIGGAHFLSRRFDEAVPKLLLAIQDGPSFPLAYRWLAACYAHMGRLDEARAIVQQLRSITPVVVSSESYLRNAEDRELFLSGLRLAAGETT